MKKIIFFDGDGTLWYPKKTKYTEKPWWVYNNPDTDWHAERHMTTTPHLIEVLKKLRAMGIILVVLSTQPGTSQYERDASLMRYIEHLKLDKYFDEIHASKGKSKKSQLLQSKGEVILKVLKRRGIPKSKALMVGDLYVPDYIDIKKIGVDAILVGYFKFNENDPNYIRVKRIKKRIPNLSGIFKHLD
jgi:HAD superfamily phosphatase (TIGR01681 family)